jgi:Xaa-Pro aminopeptidase
MIKIEPGIRYQGRPSESEMKRRWSIAADAMEREGIDCLILQANEGMLSQYVRWFAERRTPHYCVVLFDQEQNLSILGHGPEGQPLIGEEFNMRFANNISVPAFANACYANHFMSNHAINIIRKNNYTSIGLVGMNILSAAFYKNLVESLPVVKITDASELVDALITIKSQEELELLREAVQLHERIGNAVPALLYAGRLEREFGADVYRLAMLAGADEYLSNINVATAKKTGPMFPLHYQNKLIEEGECLNLLVEVPTLSGYYADFHRYWALGEPVPEMVEASELAIQVQDYMASICKPGIVCSEVFRMTNIFMESLGLPSEKRNMGHGQGYGLVERPYFDAFEPMTLKENMFISIHPSITYKGAKVVPADNYMITEDSAKRINRFQRGLIRL